MAADIYREHLGTFFHSSFNYMRFSSTVCWRTAPSHDVSTSKLYCCCGVFGEVCRAICPPNMGCIMAGLRWNDARNSAHIQKFRNPSVINAISLFCNNKNVKVLGELIAFNHHEMIHLGNLTPFYSHQLGLNKLILIYADMGQGCFQVVSWISMPFCISLSTSVKYFFLLHLPLLNIF